MNKTYLYNTVTLKIGTNVITDESGNLDLKCIKNICGQAAYFYKQGIRIILVSSGAVGAGMNLVEGLKYSDEIEKRQVLSSIGQPELIHIYKKLFAEHKIFVAQLLLTKSDFKDRKHYLNIKRCIEALWKNGVVPIINENDAVAVTELMFTDNDELSGLVASMIKADILVFATNVDGLFSGNPNKKESSIINFIDANKDVKKYIYAQKSSFGRGGMATKINIAKKIAKLGIPIHIANGKKKDFLKRILTGAEIGTKISAKSEKTNNIKRWLAFSYSENLASIHIDAGLTKILKKSDKVVSILPVGITKISCDFKKGDLIEIRDDKNEKIGLGVSAYSSKLARQNIRGRKGKALIHYDYLYILDD